MTADAVIHGYNHLVVCSLADSISQPEAMLLLPETI